MKTSAFLAALRQHPDLPLVFRPAAERTVAPGYHLTEVKRVRYDTMDCGARPHQWTETHFELWHPATREPGRAAFMTAGKFLQITDLVQRSLALDSEADVRIYVGDAGQPAALHAVASLTVADGALVARLEAQTTRCKARERQAGACCGENPAAPGSEDTGACCGREAAPTGRAPCCA